MVAARIPNKGALPLCMFAIDFLEPRLFFLLVVVIVHVVAVAPHLMHHVADCAQDLRRRVHADVHSAVVAGGREADGRHVRRDLG